MLKLGIIGMSEGNGHPYSWAAICNGYNKKYMDECPFPVIPEYLYKQKFPQDFIKDARVTHIWTQDNTISNHIANASNIGNVVQNYTDMIDKVDAILLARDDAKTHFELAKCFIEAGLPIYVDKPLAFNLIDAKKIYSLEKYKGQIFSCSAIRYAKEIENCIRNIDEIGTINAIDAIVMKKWETYSAHIIDPVLRIIGNNNKILNSNVLRTNAITSVQLKLENDIFINFMSNAKTYAPIEFRIFGSKSYKKVFIQDTFNAFKNALEEFILSIKHTDFEEKNKKNTLEMINIIERGLL